jgi:hypothetical protein
MATIGISEFTFGYAFLYEQTRKHWANLKAAPVLPSLQKEKDEGWDAHLPLHGVDFYYQFKLSDHLSRGNASYIADGTYGGAYYRLSLHRRDNNRQHQRLRALTKASPNVFYVAPEFDTIDDFNAAFLSSQITDRSRLIPVSECKDIFDSAQHHITFQLNQVQWIEHSEKKRHEGSFVGRDMEKLYGGTRREWKPIDKPFADALFERTAGVVRHVIEREERRVARIALPLLDFNPRLAERSEVLLRASQIASVVLGATLVIVGTSE